MNTNEIIRTWAQCLIVLCFASPIRAQIAGDTSLLSQAADRSEFALRALHDWSGEATISITGRPEGGMEYQSSTNVKFVYDCDHDEGKWISRVQEVLGGTRSDPRVATGMLWHNRLFELQEYIADEPRPDYLTLKISPRQPNAFPSDRLFDRFIPMQCYPQMNLNTAKTLRWYKEHANESFLTGVTIANRGGALVLESKYGTVLNRHDFDSQHGYALSGYDLTDSTTGEETCRVKYVTTRGIVVPASYSYVNRRRAKDGTYFDAIHIEVAFDKYSVNDKITSDAFSIKSLGLRNGDNVEDNTLNMDYTYVEPATAAASRP